MTIYKYIVLSNSNSSVSKRFSAIGMQPVFMRTDTDKITIGGKHDKASGAILRAYSYTLRVPAETDDVDYGTLDDLIGLFSLISPNATPSDLLTLQDHYGDSYTVKFSSDMAPEPLTTQLDGPNAWHIIQVTLQIYSEGS